MLIYNDYLLNALTFLFLYAKLLSSLKTEEPWETNLNRGSVL